MPPTVSAPERRARVLMGVVAASALVYPLLLCAVQLAWAQLLRPDAAGVALWGAVGVVCSIGVVAAVRWGAMRPVRSPWLLAGLLLPAVYELWLCWPLLTG